MKSKWGERTARRLQKLGKTQKELAETIYYSKQTVSAVMNGYYNPDIMRQIELVLRRWENERLLEKREAEL